MKVLNKLWVRLIISVLFGAFASAIYHYKTGNISPQSGNMILIFVASVTFSVLSLLVWGIKAWGLFFPKNSDKDDVLDK